MAESDIRAEELRKTRTYVRRRLTPLSVQLNRLLGHLDHMEGGDLDHIHGVLDGNGVKESMQSLREAMLAIHEPCPEDDRTDAGDGEEPTLVESIRGLLWPRRFPGK